jgi:hypothetical protein
MVQHLLLLMVAPPLIWLGAPLLPMLHGLPRWLVRTSVRQLVTSPLLLPVAWIVGQVLSPQRRSQDAHHGQNAVMLRPQQVGNGRLRLGARQEEATW